LATRRELASYVRFQLEQLTVQNRHHDFEHLCRHLARLRIASNILPATGPVTAGGDQGRDAETFRTYLAKSPLASSTFIALISDAMLVFACTVQKKNAKLKTKIKSDVSKIMGSGEVVEGIHFFFTADIDTAFRHEMQRWARDAFGVELMIYDGQSVAEFLSSDDTFWIASEYLGVPADYFPESPRDSATRWYDDSLAKWREERDPSLTFATFSEIKAALRHVTFSAEHRHDLPFWMSLMRLFVDQDTFLTLKYRAIYEILVATLRGKGTIEGMNAEIDSYFGAIHDGVIGVDHLSDMEDAAVLLAYCQGAIRLHAISLDISAINKWRDELIPKLRALLNQTVSPGRRCQLLSTLGYAVLMRELSENPGREPTALDIWLELTESVDQAPLFPLEHFADFLSSAVELIGEFPKYERLTYRVDELLSKRFGQFVAAEKCRDRAMAFYKMGKVLRAISELHRAKIQWFAEETLRGSILAIRVLSQCYSDLGLHHAAKYYALSAAWLCAQSEDSDLQEDIGEALIIASECDYVLGNWAGFLQLTETAVLSHWWFARSPGDITSHPELQRLFYHVTMVLTVAEQIDASLGTRIRAAIARWGLLATVEQLADAADWMWQGKARNQIADEIRDQLGAAPFEDLADERHARWQALGICWHAQWKNDYQTNVAAEQLIAALQIVTADLADHELLLIKTLAELEIALADVPEPEVIELADNSRRRWSVTLPSREMMGEEAIREQEISMLAVSMKIFREASLLPDTDFVTVFGNLVKQGITTKILVARSYPEILREFVPPDHSLQLTGTDLDQELLTNDAFPDPHSELVWRTGLAPNYSVADAQEAISRRYQTVPSRIPITLARLVQDDGFRELVAALRADGWKDWHILLAIGNAVWNFRLREEYGPYGPDPADRESARAVTVSLINDWTLESRDPVPLSLFNFHYLEEMLKMSALSTLKGLGMECHQLTPNLDAIMALLAERFRYWEDDVDHTDPFTDQSSNLLIVERLL